MMDDYEKGNAGFLRSTDSSFTHGNDHDATRFEPPEELNRSTPQVGMEDDPQQMLKFARDGRTVLVPQPSDNPDDPLNWSRRRKLTSLAIISYIAFLADYGSSSGIGALIPQSIQWQMPVNSVQHNLVGNLAALGGGGLVAVTLSAYFGRLPVLFVFQLCALACGVWVAEAESFNSYLAGRICSGFFATVAQGGGLMWIKDMFFFHERPRAINVWSAGVIVSPYVGPLIASLFLWHTTWQWPYRLYTILNGIGLVLIVVFMDETFYNRRIPTSQQPKRRSRLSRLVGIEQLASRHVHGTFLQAISRPFVAISRIPLALAVIYYFLNFAWVIGVNATVAIWLTEYYHFDERDLACSYIAGIVGSMAGWVIGHWIFDAVGRKYARRNNGRIEAEARLSISYLSTLLQVLSILVIGFCLQNVWHWGVLVVFYGVQVAGIMIATTAIDAYLLDSYPEGSGEIGAWVNMGRSFGGFMATYIEIGWVEKSGPALALGVQAAIVGASALIILFLQCFGKRIRAWQGSMQFATD